MTLLAKTQDFVSKLLKDNLSSEYTYHNLNHTQGVVKAVETLCEKENVSDLDKEILLIAAWFHDTGYTKDAQNHEVHSAFIATSFLIEKKVATDSITQIVALIKATEKKYVPQNELEKIIKDADYYHLFGSDYLFSCEGLRKEWQNTENKTFTDKEWALLNFDFMVHGHQFYTEYAIANWQPLKDKNCIALQQKINANTDKKEKKSKKIKAEKPEKLDKSERGVDTVFRVTLGNHTRLSGIADSKANILLSVNAIIISIALSTIIPKLDNPKYVHLMIPTLIMIVSSVTTIIFAILSTRPKVTKGIFTRQDIEEKKVNLLFFGNFYKMPLQEYQWAMNEMMKDKAYIYNTMIKDLYFLGVVLERKYRLLRVAYNFFMFGIVITVLSFIIAFKMTGS
jgi:predicted metal-dependent HD superfamily phosphohydrolase